MGIEQKMTEKGVRPTANRVLVLRAILRHNRPVSLSDLEIDLDTLDKSSIFRVLTLFSEKGILHCIEDGSGSNKYEYCHSHDHNGHNDQHAHFYCRECGQTFCFETTPVPAIDLPEGFEAEFVNYMVKGICGSCSKKLR